MLYPRSGIDEGSHILLLAGTDTPSPPPTIIGGRSTETNGQAVTSAVIIPARRPWVTAVILKPP